jgi:hypothetical protein
MNYPDMIKAAIANTKWKDADPRVVECWMRLEYGTLDHLGSGQFRDCARNYARMTIEYPEESKGLAASYGVKVEGAA